MQTRRRNIRRHGGGKMWDMAQGLRSRLGSFSLKRKQKAETAQAEPVKSHAHRESYPVSIPKECREHDPQEQRRNLPPWYHQKIFYYTGQFLRVLEADEKAAYKTALNYYLYESKTKKKVVINVSKNGQNHSFYVDAHQHFYLQKEEDDKKNQNFKIIDLETLISSPIYTDKLYDLSHDDENGTLTYKNYAQHDTDKEIYLNEFGFIQQQNNYAKSPSRSTPS